MVVRRIERPSTMKPNRRLPVLEHVNQTFIDKLSAKVATIEYSPTMSHL